MLPSLYSLDTLPNPETSNKPPFGINNLAGLEPQNHENSTNLELWNQTRKNRAIEDRLGVLSNPEIYKDFLDLLNPVNQEKWLTIKGIDKPQLLNLIPESQRETFQIALENPDFVTELARRAGVFKNYLHGKNGVSNGEKNLLENPNFALVLENLKLIDKENPDSEKLFQIFSQIGEMIDQKLLNDEQLIEIIQSLGLGTSLLSLFGQSFWRPRGYAGSFDMMEAIYNFHDTHKTDTAGDSNLEPWNQMLLNTTSAVDVDQRRSFIIQDLIADRSEALIHGKPLSIINFASGPGRLEEEFYETIKEINLNPSQVEWLCYDGDQEAVNFAQKRLSGKKIFKVEEKNILREIARPEQKNSFDEIMTVGLLDYFDDNFTIKVLSHFYAMLKVGGNFRIGQFDEGHDEESFLRLINWHLYRRSPETMRSLSVSAGIPEANIDVKKISQSGPQLIITVCKKA